MSNEPQIIYTDRFKKQHRLLSDEIKRKSAKAVCLFLENVLHPSLRLHTLSEPLKGLWSISIDKKYRITLQPIKGNTYLFVSIGTHAIYDK